MFEQVDGIRILGMTRKSDVRCDEDQDAMCYPDRVDDRCAGGIVDNKPHRDQREGLGTIL
jgi:hypothetical protein